MKQLFTIIALVFGLAFAPAWAQTVDETPPPDPVIEPTDDGGEGDGTDGEEGDGEEGDEEVEGNFSRIIPGGLKRGLTEEELVDFQARLDATTTPQERNAVRQELRALSTERQHEAIRARQEEKQGFFGGLKDKLTKGAKGSKGGGKGGGKDRGGSSKGGGGKDRGNSGGGGGKNK